MKILVALDSFKGSITSVDANRCLYDVLKKRHKVITKAIGDGGEGTMEAICDSLDGEIINLRVSGPLGYEIDSQYAICNDTAVIEMARCAGITLLKKEELNPLYTTTYGVGEMIKDALDKGCRNFIICIGGSATNDGGRGMLKALGYRFYGNNHQEVSNNGLGLKDLCFIDKSGYDKRLDESHFMIASDVENPLCGINGASYVFARQKGADEKTIALMDKWLKNYADISGFDPDVKGAGAAGGLGFALKYYLNAQMLRGIDLVIKSTGIEEIIRDVDLVICGEGKIDRQTLSGKAPYGIAVLAKKYHKRVIAVGGSIEFTPELDEYFDEYYKIMDYSLNLDDALTNVREYLRLIGQKINNSLKGVK
ncbi:MAG: glycerate kinase [Erysipelotrichaceae bacterium]